MRDLLYYDTYAIYSSVVGKNYRIRISIGLKLDDRKMFLVFALKGLEDRLKFYFKQSGLQYACLNYN